MIQPNELRIKNIIKNPRYFKEWGQHLYQTVECICGKDISTNKDDWDADYLEPVELTPDILEAAGFKYNQLTENYEIFIDFEGLIALNKYDYSIFIGADNEDRGYTGRTSTACKYLHQLQNLYRCLTGEELQIELTKLNKEK